ncbi:alpha/beta hydrolase fold domain-containing protein [Streptomyces sp. NPDC024017]|uniref:alpha/beta hydrolase fold domain-containing protein n=1 Tax=Streptomyces sp. NPDC024017 TaxID=3154326 RepID=UPI0034064069
MDDAEAAFNWLLSEGYEPGNIITIGHSIGGFIAVALALRLRDKKSRCAAPSRRFPHGATSRSPTRPW